MYYDEMDVYEVKNNLKSFLLDFQYRLVILKFILESWYSIKDGWKI